MTIRGGCFCGAIRYEFDTQTDTPDVPVADCHCTMCRRISGAPYVTWQVVPVDQFRYVSGEVRTLASSKAGTRYFCGDCGTPIACVNQAHPEVIDLTLGSLDEPERFPPRFSVYEDTRLPHLE